MPKKIKIVEVGPRDGLQNEKQILSPQTKLKLIKKLSDAHLKYIEVGSFVSPKWVPQMQGSGKLIQRLFKSELKQSNNLSKLQKKYSSLVPNLRGMNDALKTPIKRIAIFAACSEGFSQKNINCSIDESFERFTSVVQVAKKNKIKVRGYLSTAFYCPFDGPVKPKKVLELTNRMLDLGVYEVAISDTIGRATPKNIEQVLNLLIKNNIPLKKIALHFHNTHGTALANVLQGLKMGVTTFDASVGGLGGCPYAGQGASGNLATEDLVYMLQGMGYKTGIDLEKLIAIKSWLNKSCHLETKSHQ